MEQGIIYLITNIKNNKKYIGQTKQQLNKRWLQHINESKTFNDRPLYNAMKKYGLDNFKIRILEECDTSNLNEREIYWINYYNSYKNGYNATTGGDHFEHNEETKEKISKTMSHLSRSDEWINNISKAHKIKLENGEKWGIHICKNEGGKHHKRKIQAINVKNKETLEFESLTEAALKIAGNSKYVGNISRAIKNDFTVNGYKFKRINETPICKPVVGYDKKTGELIYEFESANKASLKIRGKRGTGIQKSLKNPGKYSWMKCYWYYK